jgi:transposase
MKPVAIGRKNRMLAGSQRGGNSIAIAFTLIEAAKLNRLDELMLWNYNSAK